MICLTLCVWNAHALWLLRNHANSWRQLECYSGQTITAIDRRPLEVPGFSWSFLLSFSLRRQGLLSKCQCQVESSLFWARTLRPQICWLHWTFFRPLEEFVWSTGMSLVIAQALHSARLWPARTASAVLSHDEQSNIEDVTPCDCRWKQLGRFATPQ